MILAILASQGDPILPIFTVVLAGVTAVLVWVTWRLGSITKSVGDKSDALKIMPLLTFGEAVTYLDGTTEYIRFSVVNIYVGPAKPSEPNVRVKDGRKLEIRHHTKTEFAITSVPYYFDIYGAKVDEEVIVELDYTDMKGKNKQSFTKTFTVQHRGQKL